MEAKDPMESDELLLELRGSRLRFQALMRRLMEKYDRPFEDAPLVQMSTLTYETPHGLKVWGGSLIKKRKKKQTEDSLVVKVSRLRGQATVEGSEQPPCSQVLGAESDSPEESLASKDLLTYSLLPTVPRSPLKNELRRKYLTQVDVLLQDADHFKGTEKGEGKDTPVTLVSSPASSVTTVPGYHGSISPWNPGDPEEPANMAIALRNDSVSFLGASSNSSPGNQSFEADDICNITISDLYEGMLHSMSRLLSSKPSCIISTKTHWNPRRRLPHKSRVRANLTLCHRVRPCWKSSKGRSAPSLEPGEEPGVLRDHENLPHVAHHKKGTELEKAFLGGSKPQIRKSGPTWTALQLTPCKWSSLTYLDMDSVPHLNQENRLNTLTWLISPVKKCRSSMLLGWAEDWHKEIEVKFNRLHQEYCLSSRKRPRSADSADSWALGVYRGGLRSPGAPPGIRNHTLSLSFKRKKAKKLEEAFEGVSRSPVRIDGCPPKSTHSSLSESSASQSPGHSQQTSGLFLQEHNSGTSRKVVTSSAAVSALDARPPGYGRAHYDKIKEKFDKLHQKYYQTPPPQAKAPSQVRVSPGNAKADVRCQSGDLSQKLNSSFLSSPRLSPQWCIKSPQDSAATEARLCAWTTKDPQFPTKRCKLSYPQVFRHHVGSQDPSEEADQASVTRRQGQEEHIFQGGRKK